MKEYRSRWNGYILNVRIGRREHRIKFKGFVREKESFLRTDDKKLQQALEANPLFGTDYYLYKDETPTAVAKAEKQAKAEAEPEKEKDIAEDVTNITQAREYLIEKGIDYRRLNTPNSIMKQAAENNIEFPNLEM